MTEAIAANAITLRIHDSALLGLAPCGLETGRTTRSSSSGDHGKDSDPNCSVT